MSKNDTRCFLFMILLVYLFIIITVIRYTYSLVRQLLFTLDFLNESTVVSSDKQQYDFCFSVNFCSVLLKNSKFAYLVQSRSSMNTTFYSPNDDYIVCNIRYLY